MPPPSSKLLSLAPGVEQSLAEMFGRGRGQAAVLPPVPVLRPCVEMKVDDGGLCLFAGPPSYEDRPAVASPSAVRRVQNELDPARVGARALQIGASQLLVLPGVDHHADDLAGSDLAYHLAIH